MMVFGCSIMNSVFPRWLRRTFVCSLSRVADDMRVFKTVAIPSMRQLAGFTCGMNEPFRRRVYVRMRASRHGGAPAGGDGILITARKQAIVAVDYDGITRLLVLATKREMSSVLLTTQHASVTACANCLLPQTEDERHESL